MTMVLVMLLLVLFVQYGTAYVIDTCKYTTSMSSMMYLDANEDDCSCFYTDSTNPCPENYYCPVYSQADLTQANVNKLTGSNCTYDASGGSVVKVQCPCPPGFFCPANTEQPRYCCKGFYCPYNAAAQGANLETGAGTWGSSMVECPDGSYCPIGAVQTLDCVGIETCEKGSEKPDRTAVLVILLVFVVLLFLAFVVLGMYRTHVKEVQEKSISLYSNEEHTEGNADGTARTDDVPLHIDFKDITFLLRDGRSIMRGVHGSFAPGRLCAIMGPSGAGKTTVINLITGKAQRSGGTVHVNGKVVDDLGDFKDDIGFVPQEDIMIRDLTVRDNIAFSAAYRLPAHLSSDAVSERVNGCITDLGISHVQHSQIGDEMTRGISGGQRKRVNIGLELVAEPRILFLDEPTSGLDSTSSLTLIKMLKRIANSRKMTVASVIHQPSMGAFHEFDDLLLLGKGGMVIYHGPLNAAPAYFAAIGFPVPPKCNPADWYLDVSQEAAERIDFPEFEKEDLFDLWEGNRVAHPAKGMCGQISKAVAIDLEEYRSVHASSKGQVGPSASSDGIRISRVSTVSNMSLGADAAKLRRKSVTVAQARLNEIESSSSGSWLSHTWNTLIDVSHDLFVLLVDKIALFSDEVNNEVAYLFAPARTVEYPRPGMLVQFRLCAQRAGKQVFADFYGFMGEMLIHLGIGFVISNSASRLEYMGPYLAPICAITPLRFVSDCDLPQIDLYSATGKFLCFGTTFAGIITGASTFGYEQVNYFRESASGLKSVPYFWAKVMVNFPKVYLASILFYLPMSRDLQNNSTTAKVLNLVIVTYFFAFSIGYCVSQVVQIKMVPLVAVFIAVILLVIFSGVASVKLTDVHSRAGKNIFKMSGNRWTIEAFYKSQTQPLQTLDGGMFDGLPYIDIASGTENLGYGGESYEDCMLALSLVAVFFTFVALGLMLCCHRDKKK